MAVGVVLTIHRKPISRPATKRLLSLQFGFLIVICCDMELTMPELCPLARPL